MPFPLPLRYKKALSQSWKAPLDNLFYRIISELKMHVNVSYILEFSIADGFSLVSSSRVASRRGLGVLLAAPGAADREQRRPGLGDLPALVAARLGHSAPL